MMDKAAYEEARKRSNSMFKNALVLPAALAILRVGDSGASFKLSDLREELGGRVADNQIREALKRIESSGAVHQLNSLGPPHPDFWERLRHPFWDFVANWVGHLADVPAQSS